MRTAGSLESLLELSARHEREGLGRCAVAAAVQEAARRAAARAAVAPARRKHPLIEIGRAQRKDDALAGLERWKARHADAAVASGTCRCAGRFHAWTLIDLDAHPRQPAARAGRSCGPSKSRSIRTQHRITGCRQLTLDAAAPKTFSSS